MGHLLALLELKIRQLFYSHDWDDFGWGPNNSQFQMCHKCWRVKK